MVPPLLIRLWSCVWSQVEMESADALPIGAPTMTTATRSPMSRLDQAKRFLVGLAARSRVGTPLMQTPPPRLQSRPAFEQYRFVIFITVCGPRQMAVLTSNFARSRVGFVTNQTREENQPSIAISHLQTVSDRPSSDSSAGSPRVASTRSWSSPGVSSKRSLLRTSIIASPIDRAGP
jgi:hypothetical protein